MKLSVCIPTFFRQMPLEKAVEQLSALGYEYAEFWGMPKDTDIDAVCEACKKHGVTLVAMCPDKFNLTDASFHGEYIESLEIACKRAKKLGITRLISQVGNDTGESREIQHGNIVAGLKRAVPVLEKYGITLVIEPLNTLVDHKGYYLVTSEEGFDIVREVDSDNVKLLFDIYHQQVSEGNVISNVINNLDLIGHLHSAGNPGRHELWMGELNYEAIFEAIDNAGYNGFCALEYKPTLEPVESLSECKKRYMK